MYNVTHVTPHHYNFCTFVDSLSTVCLQIVHVGNINVTTVTILLRLSRPCVDKLPYNCNTSVTVVLRRVDILQRRNPFVDNLLNRYVTESFFKANNKTQLCRGRYFKNRKFSEDEKWIHIT